MDILKRHQGELTVISAVILIVLIVTTVMDRDSGAPAVEKQSSATTSQPNQDATKDTSAGSQPQSASKSSSNYVYVAQAGDSYTVLARKAIQTYGIENKVKLSHAQIVAAETFIASDAGFPELNEQATVTLEHTAIVNAVQKAQGLTIDQLAEWGVYVGSVDFNTNLNGQA